jgi:hypothetical protein
MANEGGGRPFFVVFDTCTHARYYGDVHEVLALPEGSVIRYEYKRSLFKADAANALDRLVDDPSKLPVDALLMYGQKRDYKQGEPDPADMLCWNDSFFVPTRSARIVAVAREPGADPPSDVLHFHLEMRGFVDPDSELIEPLVRGLESANSLPFGQPGERHAWVALLPDDIQPKKAGLITDDQRLWPRVVDKLMTLPTQFEKDVFWRVRHISSVSRGAPPLPLPLENRKTNIRVHTTRWHRDYRLYETDRYEIFVQTYAPSAHGNSVPGNATISMTTRDDDQGLIKLSANPLDIVPNETTSQRFSIDSDAALETRYAGVRLETQIPGWTSAYPAGSVCTLTFAIQKRMHRLLLGVLFLLGAAFVGAAYTSPKITASLEKGGLAALALLLFAAGVWMLTKQFKIIR